MAYTTTTLAESSTHAKPVRRRRSGRRLLVWATGIVVTGGGHVEWVDKQSWQTVAAGLAPLTTRQ
jgi:hypothetical protein